MAMIRIALAQFDFPVGDVAGNAARIAEMAGHARDVLHADVVLFPEQALCGYPAEDLLLKPSFLLACDTALRGLAAELRGITAIVGHPEAVGSVVYNAASVLRDGHIEATYRKRELPNCAVFDERRYFATGDRPFVFDVKGATVGLLVCEDLWFAKPLADTTAQGACLVLVPNASPFEVDKHLKRDALLERRVQETGVAVAYLNLVGGQDELVFDGGSMLADGDGTLHPSAEVFADHWLVADFDPSSRRFSRVQWAEETEETHDALAWRALVRATRDYLGKNGRGRAWLGLSGGLDSAITLAIAVDALGAGNVTAVALPSRYTADLSNDLAAEQARLLGVRLLSVPIEPAFEGLMQSLDSGLAIHGVQGSEVLRGAAAEAADLMQQNLQARARGTLLMALSNLHGGFLLTTGNKSEYAVGYSTLYGDMAGAFAPLKDVYKTDVYALARWRNGKSPAIPEGVLKRPPTAELRAGQVDQDSLPPYELLDAVLYRFVDLERSVDEIVAEGYDAAVVRKVARMVYQSEFKRRQSAPGPKVSGRAFGRERRYPITSAWR